MTKSAGGILIKLMIPVAIVGNLSATETPARQGHIVSAQISRVVGELSAYKAPFEGYMGSGGSVTNNDIGYNPPNLPNSIQAVNIGALKSDGSGQL
jgi:type IV pilus assembly protein PilA